MRISKVLIENFRSIKKLELDLGATTVLIGPNNSGKTAILDAIRIALTRKWGQSGSGFSEYDVHLADENSDPKTSPGVSIEIRVEEEANGDWSEAVQQDLDNIIQVDPITGKSFVTLQTKCAWSETEEAFVPAWVFLNAARAPLLGASARRINLERFWQYLPVFYLGALRDADDEFSPRSQFWGRLLKAVQIPNALESRVHRVLDLLNRRLLAADPKLAQIAETLSGAPKVAARHRDGSAELRLLPLKSWDLLSKAEIIVRNEKEWPWLPLKRHGQGLQSLSVLFLFQSFVDHLLAELFEADSAPILALEEPETHLHPQAARTLWSHVQKITGQKIIATHSPYFVQSAPFRDLRLVKLTSNGTEIRSLPSEYSTRIPNVPQLAAEIANSHGLLTYEVASGMLTVRGKLEDPTYRRILALYGTHAERTSVTNALRDLKQRSSEYVSDSELNSLETFARRIRGEIFFASKWLIVEGQAEYLLVHGIAKASGTPLDEYGIAVIDAMNNGSPAAFVVLARALGIPWIAVFDGDPAGNQYKQTIASKGFEQALVDARCRLLPQGTLEQQLLASGLGVALREILVDLGHPQAANSNDQDARALLEESKTAYSARLASKIQEEPNVLAQIPPILRSAITDILALT